MKSFMLFIWCAALATQSVLILSQQVAAAADNIPEAEYLALYDLYDANHGADWFWGQQSGIEWNFTANANPCADEWEGITCTSASSYGNLHVELVELDGYNLLGYLPDSISNLTYLVELSLRNNDLSARCIPSSIGQLRRLQRLDMGSAGLSLQFPDVFGDLISLQYLDLSVNQLTGGLPRSLCEAHNLTDINLSENHFSGTILECLDQLTELGSLALDNNKLVGTLPAILGSLPKLEIIIVGINQLCGTIPLEYEQLRHMQTLDVSSNLFNGTVPAFLGNFADMIALDLGFNDFSGTIPPSFGNLQIISSLVMHYNNLNGTFPQSMCNLTSVEELDFNSNHLTGTLPRCWGHFLELQFIALYENHFSGPIPDEWAHLALLREFLLTTNHLTGTIPDIFVNMTELAALIVDDNELTGTVPGDTFLHPLMEVVAFSHNELTGTLPSMNIDDISVLLFIALAGNHFSGTISENISNYRELLYFDISTNAFSGTVPEDLCELRILNYMYMMENRLTGTLPNCWGGLSALSYLYLNKNLLTGSIPRSIGEISLLQSLNLSSNHLSGSIPRSLSNLSQLEVMLLQRNALTGSLDGVFEPSSQLRLATVQVGNNQLTGTLPDDLFHLPNLKVFAAVSNCFTGSIPTAICGSGTLLTLALDGLQSATSCRRRFFPASFNGIVAPNLYAIGSPLSGGVPTCLFQMANLTTLHLSGNGLTGTLTFDLAISPKLTDLSLSHNNIVGRIPASMLSRNWVNLDLSYNVFTHSLTVERGFTFNARSTITLEQNRFSGKIPGALSEVTSISILESNLFACNAQRSDLPPNDPNEGKYQCGSDTWNATIYAWIAVSCVTITMLAVLWWWRAAWATEIAMVRKWWEAGELICTSWAVHMSSLSNYNEVRKSVGTVMKFSTMCGVFIMCALLPLDGILCAFYGTYEHAYAWALSAAYVSGPVPFGLMFVCLSVLVISVAIYAARLTKTRHEGVAPTEVTDVTAVRGVPWSRIALYGFYITLNFMIVLGVNIAYVVIALNQNGEALTLAQISLALFKVAFNGVCSPLLIRWTSHRVLKSSEEASTADLISIQLFVSLLNNITIPCLVVAIISPDCFYNIFNAASEVRSSFAYPGKCVSFSPLNSQFVTCSGEETLTAITSYNPPFAYSYQCSSSFITYYAPAYVIMCIIASFGIPVAQVLLQRLHSRAVKGTRWFALLDLLLPRILKPIYGVTSPSQRNVFAPYFDATQHMITLLTYVGLLLTFGAVFPPLALCFAVTIASIAAFTKLKVGRFLAQAVELDTPQYLTVVNQECEGVGSAAILARSIYMMVVFCCLFYTLFLFDTLGDAIGASKAYWVLIVVPLMPVVLFVANAALKYFERPLNEGPDGTTVRETEMIAVEVRSPLSKL